MSSGDRTNKLCHVCETLHRFLRLSDECSSITCMTCNQSRGKSKRRLCEQPTIAASDEELAAMGRMQVFSVQSQSMWDIVDGESQPESSWCLFFELVKMLIVFFFDVVQCVHFFDDVNLCGAVNMYIFLWRGVA